MARRGRRRGVADGRAAAGALRGARACGARSAFSPSPNTASLCSCATRPLARARQTGAQAAAEGPARAGLQGPGGCRRNRTPPRFPHARRPDACAPHAPMRARALPQPGPAAADDDPLRRFLETAQARASARSERKSFADARKLFEMLAALLVSHSLFQTAICGALTRLEGFEGSGARACPRADPLIRRLSRPTTRSRSPCCFPPNPLPSSARPSGIGFR